VSPHGLAGLGVVAALFLAVALASAPGSAVGRAAAGPEAGAADAGAAPRGWAARRRCVRFGRRHPVARPAAPPRRRNALARRTAPRRAKARSRRFACTRMKRLAGAPPASDRLVPVAAPAPSPDGPSPAPGTPQLSPPEPLARFVSVAAREWSLTLSRPVVGAGSVTIELRNLGEDPHNLVVSPDDGSHDPLAGWAETGPGDFLRQSVTLPAGRYLLFCSLEGHEAAGMSARLRVD
jgi:hypothetical protein